MSRNQTVNDESSQNVTFTNTSATFYDLFNDYEQSDCQVSSNDPASQLKPSLKICNYTRFQCSSSSSDSKIVAVQVPFDYELHYNPEAADLQRQVLPYLEESMLRNVATALGVTQCNNRRKRHQRQKQRRNGATDQSVVGTSLEPRDILNDSSSCKTTQRYLQSGDNCAPITGEMTLFLQLQEGEQETQLDAAKEKVSLFLKESMDNDLFVVPGYIEKVAYTSSVIGNDGGVAVNTVASNSSIENDGGWPAWKTGLVATAAILLLLQLILICCCCFFCCRSRKKRRTNHADSSSQLSNVHNENATRDLPSQQASTMPFWATTSVDTDIEDGVEQCLASKDSLALRSGYERMEPMKPSCDESSVDTSRTSVASASVVARDVEEPSNATVNQSDDAVITAVSAISVAAVVSQKVKPGSLDHRPTVKPEDFEQLDRLVMLNSTGTDQQGDILLNTPEFSAERSLSPTTGSQITMLAGNLRAPVETSKASSPARDLVETSQDASAMSKGSNINLTQSRNQFGTSTEHLKSSLSGSPMPRLHESRLPMLPKVNEAIESDAPRAFLGNNSTASVPTVSKDLHGQQLPIAMTPETRGPIESVSKTARPSKPKSGSTKMLSGNLKTPKYSVPPTQDGSSVQPSPPISRAAVLPVVMYKGATRENVDVKDVRSAIMDAKVSETLHDTVPLKDGRRTVEEDDFQRISTYGMHSTSATGYLRSSTYGSQTTARAGNLASSKNRSDPGSQIYHNTAMSYQEVPLTMDVPDSFDEEIMGIISEDNSDEDYYSEDHRPVNLDVLDGHGPYQYQDTDGPGINETYFSDDSDSEQLSHRSGTEEQAKKKLQMS